MTWFVNGIFRFESTVFTAYKCRLVHLDIRLLFRSVEVIKFKRKQENHRNNCCEMADKNNEKKYPKLVHDLHGDSSLYCKC